MSNRIYGHVGYGILLLEHSEDECVPGALLRFGTDDILWSDSFLRYLYPGGVPEELEISSHHLKGHYSEGEGRCEVPLLVIGGYPNYGITDSRGSPDDISRFLKAFEEKGRTWDELIADFVKRCTQAGFILAETTPHPILFLSWDEIGH